MDHKEVRESYLIRYDSTGKLIDNYYDAVPSAITKISASPPKYRLKFDIALPAVTVGDLVAVRPFKTPHAGFPYPLTSGTVLSWFS